MPNQTPSSPEHQEDEGPDPIDIAIGARIRARRKWLNITQSGLGNHLGVSFQQVQKYERGANRVSGSVLVKIAQHLETTVAELVGETRAPESDPEIAHLLAQPMALEMLQALSQVPKRVQRTRLVELVRAMGEEAEATPRLRAVG